MKGKGESLNSDNKEKNNQLTLISTIKIDIDFCVKKFLSTRRVWLGYSLALISHEIVDLNLRFFWIWIDFKFLNWFFNLLKPQIS